MSQDSLTGSKVHAWLAWLVLALLLAAFHVMTPRLWDDWSYQVDSFVSIFPEVVDEYFGRNSRMPGIFMTRFLTLWPDWLTDVFGVCMALLAFGLMAYIAFGRRMREYLCHWQLPVLLWVLLVMAVPVFGEVMFWHCGMVSYLLSVLFCLGVLALLRPLLDAVATTGALPPRGLGLSWWWWPLLLVLGWLAGESNFNTGDAVLVLVVGLMLVQWKILRRDPAMWVLLVGLLVGSLMVLLSSGNEGRMLEVEAGGGSDSVSMISMLGRIAEPHWRSVLIYVVAAVAIVRRCRTGSWSREDTLLCGAMVLVALASQGCFLFSPATPPQRIWCMTFMVLAIAELRVILPWLLVCRRRRLANAVLLLLACLPLCALPKTIAQYQWMRDAYARVEAQRGSGDRVVLPYWRFTKDKLFGFVRSFVSTEPGTQFPNQALAHLYGLSDVVQSDWRCSYAGACGDFVLQGRSFDRPGYATLTCWKVQASGVVPQTETLSLYIAHPDRRNKWWSPKAVLARCAGSSEVMTPAQLRERGYTIDVLPLAHAEAGEEQVVDWLRVKKYSMMPSAPDLWLFVGSSALPEDAPMKRLRAVRNELPMHSSQM